MGTLTVVGNRNLRHSTESGGLAGIDAVLHEPWEVDAHWCCAALPSGMRPVKNACKHPDECASHEEGECDTEADGLAFDFGVVEVDLHKNIKALPEDQRLLGFADLVRIVYRLAKDGLIPEPRHVSPSKSYGMHLIYELSETFYDAREYEAHCLGLRDLITKVMNPLIAAVGKVDDSPSDWTRLWRCCKVTLDDGETTFHHDALDLGGMLDLGSIMPRYPKVYEKKATVTDGGERSEAVECSETTRYGLAALRSEARSVAKASSPGRSKRLLQAACRAGELVAGGEATEEKAADILLSLGAEPAGLVDDYSEDDIIRQIENGMLMGKDSPRRAPKRRTSSATGAEDDGYSGEDPETVDAWIKKMDASNGS